MIKKLLTHIPALIILSTLPAIAQTPNTDAAITDAVKTAAEDAKEAYEKIKAAVISETSEKSDIDYIMIDPRMTALGIIGQSIVNNDAVNLGTAEDIILNSDGKADAIIITHGGYFKFGSKMAAFDYDLVMHRESDGDVVMPLTKENVEKAKAFSYDRNESDNTTRVISETGMSTKELLKASLVDNNDVVVAKAENLYFKDGYASRVIFGFDKTLNMGGEKTIIDYNSLKLEKSDGVYKFKMNEKQSVMFDNFRKKLAE